MPEEPDQESSLAEPERMPLAAVFQWHRYHFLTFRHEAKSIKPFIDLDIVTARLLPCVIMSYAR